jgi:D-alanyl-D-alanine carboxypeptidase/D-alanyl-D-alanine-endopeptidase (penicillin-binding protein 4)
MRNTGLFLVGMDYNVAYMNARNYTTLFWFRLARQRLLRSLGVVVGICFLVASASAELPGEIRKSLSQYHIPETSVSAMVVPLDSGEALLSHRANTPRNPASVMKLLTTYAALEILGPAYTWKTRFYIHGTLKNGVLDGDLVIKGGGDPYLVQEQFWLQLAALREMGIETIKGNLLIDNSAFDLPPHDRSEFDEQPTRLYNVGPSATMLNFNASRFRLHPKDGKVEVLLDPPIQNVIVNNRLKLVKGACHGARGGWFVDVAHKQSKAYVVFSGQYKSQCGSYDLNRAVLDSNAYLYGVFAYLWNTLGGKFQGGYASVEVKEDATPFYIGESKPLAEVINGANKYSNNLLARQLLLAVAYHYFGEGASVKDGVDSVRAWLNDKGLQMPGLVMENGSGLSRQISMSAAGLNKMLIHAANSLYHPEFMASFSLSGMDGTMKKRLKDLNLGGRARLKTGYVKGVRTLAGYLRAYSGRDYAVVLFVSDARTNFSNGNVIQDEFIKWALEAG